MVTGKGRDLAKPTWASGETEAEPTPCSWTSSCLFLRQSPASIFTRNRENLPKLKTAGEHMQGASAGLLNQFLHHFPRWRRFPTFRFSCAELAKGGCFERLMPQGTEQTKKHTRRLERPKKCLLQLENNNIALRGIFARCGGCVSSCCRY